VIIDTSAIIAILRGEPDAGVYIDVIDSAPRSRVSAASYVEAGIVIDGSRDPVLSRRLDEYVMEAPLIIEPVTEEQAHIARAAYRDFGKGSGHPAQLNFGDCFAYALARDKREPLLFKGSDFIHTDITPALTADA
jgi:ribonuclease VapC